MPIDFSKLKKHKLYQEGSTTNQNTSKNVQNKRVLNNENIQKTLLATVNRTDNNTIMQRVQERYEANMARQSNAVLYKKDNAKISSLNTAKENSLFFGNKKSNQTEQYHIKNLGDIRNSNRNIYAPEQKYMVNKSTIYKSPTADSINEELILNMANNTNKKERTKIVNSLVNNKTEQQKLYTKVENYAREIEARKDAKKINSDLKNRKIGSSAGHIVKGLPTGAVNTMLNIGGTIASLNPNMDDNIANTAKSLTSKYGQTNAQIDNQFVKTAGTVTHTIGNMLPSMAVGGAVGAVGTTGTLASNAGGIMNALISGASSYLETLNEEQTNKLNSFFTGLAKGTVTFGTEKISGGNLITKGSLDDVVAKGISKRITNSGAQWLASKAYEVGGEIEEENLENVASYLIDSFINNQKVSIEQIKEDFKQTSTDTFWTTVVLNALGLGGNTYKDVKNISNIQKTNNDIVNNSNLSEEQKASLKRVAEKHNMTTEEVQNLINNPPQENTEQIPQNQGTKLVNNEVLQNNQQINQEENKMPQNGNMEQIEQNNQNQENTLVNNQETLYNNTESEVDSNGVQRRGMGESEKIAGTIENEKTQYTTEGFRQAEQSAKEQQTNNLTTKQAEIKNKFENETKKEIRFFDGNENDIPAFASEQEKNVIYINIKTFENYDYNKVIYHENLESEITHNNEINEIAKETARAIMKDTNFNNQINEFFKDSETTTDNSYAIAKDIICDMYAKYVTGEELDYNNVLDLETNTIINDSLEKIDNIINNTENLNESSFSLSPDQTKTILPPNQTMPLKIEKEEVTMKINLEDNTQLPPEAETKLPQDFDEDLRAIKEASQKGLGDTLSTDEQLQAIQNLDTKELDNRLPDTSNMIVNKLKKEKTTFKEFTTMIRKLVTNKGAGVDDLFKATGNKQGTWKYDRYLGSFSEGQTSIGINQVNAQGEVVGDSLLDIYDNAKKDGITQKILDDYVLNKDNIARSNYERGLYGESITAKDSKKIIDEYDKKYPQLKDYAKQVSDFANHNTESYLVGTFISQDLYDHMRAMYPDHVPVVRDIAETPGMSEYDNVGTQVLKSAKGGDEAILSPKEALAQQSVSYAKAYRRNEALKEVYKSIKSDTKVLYDLGQIVDIEQANLEIENAVGYDENLKKYTATIFENGEAKIFEISKDIYDAFTQSEAMTRFEDTIDKLMIGKVLKKASSGFKSLTTGKNILYALKNMVRDINDAPINSTTNFANFMKDWGYSYEQIVTNGKYYKEYVNSGGSANTFYDYNKGLLKSDYSSLPRKAIDFINNVTIGNIETINEVVETAPRLAEYIATRKRGGSIDEALYNASEVTTNFKRGGSLTKLVDKYGVPYLNASVQGLSKVYRNVTDAKGFGQYAKLIINSAVAGVLPSLLNHLIYEDDDDYEQLEDYLKDGYYLIKVNDLPKSLQNTLGKWTENNFVRIPKGRISAVLGDTAIKIYETTQGDTDTWKGYINDVVLNNIGINNPLTNNLFSALTQSMNNEAWYGGSIYSETKYDEMLPVEITDEKTDKLSNWVAETLYNMVGEDKYKELVDKEKGNAFFRVLATPKLLNYVMDQYSGFIGDIVLPKLTPYAEDNAFVDQFTTSSTLKSSVVSEFYEIIDNCYENSLYATDMDKLTSKYLGEVSKDIGSLYADKASIQGDSNLTDKQKQQQTYEIQEQINQKMQEAIDKVKNAEISNNTASFNDTEYYKDEEGNWKKITDKNKIEGLSIETYADYKNKTAKALASKRKKEGDDATLTTKERLSILTNSTYTDKEKDMIYAKTTGKKDETYSNLKLINRNDVSKIDDYLTYKVANIKGDEDTKSEVKDAIVKNSKKKNVINYINNSNFNGFEKLYLYGKSYKLSSSEQKQFDSYMKISNLTSEQKKKIYLDMSGVEELKDGSIRWK